MPSILFLLTLLSTLFYLTSAGDFTFYTNMGVGACGTQVDASMEFLAAVSFELFTTPNPNNDPICDKCVTVTYKGKSIIVPIRDKCPTCARDHVDLSKPAFAELENSAVGHAFGAAIQIVPC